jgi:hypothetical protein
LQTELASSPDGTHLLILAYDGNASVWDLRPGRWVNKARKLAGGSLTRAEWKRYLPDSRYHPVC